MQVFREMWRDAPVLLRVWYNYAPTLDAEPQNAFLQHNHQILLLKKAAMKPSYPS